LAKKSAIDANIFAVLLLNSWRLFADSARACVCKKIMQRVVIDSSAHPSSHRGVEGLLPMLNANFNVFLGLNSRITSPTF